MREREIIYGGPIGRGALLAPQTLGKKERGGLGFKSFKGWGADVEGGFWGLRFAQFLVAGLQQ